MKLSILLPALAVFAVQAISYPQLPPPPPQPWTSGETTVTLSYETLTVSGLGAMENHRDSASPNYYYSVSPWHAYSQNVRDGDIRTVIIKEGVTYIGKMAFAGLSLQSVTVPASVTSIGAGAFIRNFYLKSITVAEDNAHYCSEDGILFNKDKTVLICYPPGKQDSAYTIPGSVTAIGDGAFCHTRLASITIPSSVTAIGEGAFAPAHFLTSITIPGSVASIGKKAFAACTRLTSVTIEDGVREIGNNAFKECISLTSVTIPSSVTSIGESAFNTCESLDSVAIPNGVSVIEHSAFFMCTSLTSATIPNGVAAIEDYAFFMCRSLRAVTIPTSVTRIGERAFTEPMQITVLNPKPPKAAPDAFAACWWMPLYVPARGFFAYRGNEVWSEFGSIRPIVTRELIALGIIAALALSAAVFVTIKKLRRR